ncbi:hypothetical protein Ancab_024418 [Ancistrocladus abbreviatus]
MASPLSSLLLTLVVVCAFVAPTFCTVSHSSVAQDSKKSKVGFRTTLEHVDSGKNLTKLERAKRSIERGNRRIERFKVMDYGQWQCCDASLPQDTMMILLGPNVHLVWCVTINLRQSFIQRNPLPLKSLPCFSELCLALGPQEKCLSDCPYTYKYEDDSSTSGYMASETFTFKSADSQVSVPNIAFGCGLVTQGEGWEQGAGLVGMGTWPVVLTFANR